ncbi:PAS domain S-box protein [Aneurinibacillus sp. Ricciae_BoGa-3]|uniref:PAS domain-containing sensor histidine kinase n=1 Tax=Aneurinibacillus sp. Ricciae_BoGa-3 TaxID=3022697 RepID=UPI00233F953A|nr:PAS domain-containing sensor histidine kinase [Aneurinibacillus sp. Ricciae_BoGa-3]WCK56260.1 PAS domain S-box protein [Aneurinibacillus sp. Ricciae_BoGa-3]
MADSLNGKRAKMEWSSYKTLVLYFLLLSFYFIITNQLLLAYSLHPKLLSFIHLMEDLFFVVISSLILYRIIKIKRKKIEASHRKLEENQKTLYTLINNIPDLVYLKNEKGEWIEANESAVRFFKIDNSSYKGKISAIIINPYKDKASFASVCERTDYEAWTSKKSVRYEQILEKDGTSKTYDVIKVPIFDSDGEPKVLVVTARDITERKLTESKLKESEQRYESLYNSISGGVILKDAEGNVLHANKEACKIFGVDPEEIHGTNLSSWKFFKHDGSILPIHEHPYMIALHTGQRIRNFIMGVQFSKQSPYRWILANCEPISNTANDPPRKVLCTFLDVTSLKEIQEKLKESEERYRLLVEHSLDKIIVLNKDGFCFINKEGAIMMGAQTPEEIIGKNSTDFIPKDYQNYIKSIIEKVQREKVVIGPSQHEIVTLDNRVIDLETIFIPITYEGEPASLCVSRNITERKRTEEALRKADTLSIAGNLAAGVAHEVRNPLTVIRGFIQLFKQQDKKNTQYFDLILDEVNRIELIISEFLMLSKPQSHIFKENSIQKIIQHTVTLFETQVIMKNINIVTAYDDDLPLIECEENQLKQVFINLLKNAMEAMPNEGTISVKVKRQENGIVIHFTDQGCGIPPEKITKLGEPFYTTKEKGTGLGLMVSYNIIKNHKGTVNIISKPGEGTSFEIFLPLNRKSVSLEKN